MFAFVGFGVSGVLRFGADNLTLAELTRESLFDGIMIVFSEVFFG